MSKLSPSSPISHKIVVGTLAVCAGMYAFWTVGRDYQFVKFEPRLKEDIERRQKEGVGISIQHLETRTLDYTPEAKERLRKGLEERLRKDNGEESK